MIHELHQQGLSIAEIARQTGKDRKTVRKYLRQGVQAPSYGPRAPRPQLLDPYRDDLRERVSAYPKRLGARLGTTAVLHTWGSAITHQPHLHCIVPGGGLSLDGTHWVAARSGFFLPVRVHSRLFRRLFFERLVAAHAAGRLQFFAQHRPLAGAGAFAGHLVPLRRTEWVVHAKRPFAGPAAVLA